MQLRIGFDIRSGEITSASVTGPDDKRHRLGVMARVEGDNIMVSGFFQN